MKASKIKNRKFSNTKNERKALGNKTFQKKSQKYFEGKNMKKSSKIQPQKTF